MTNIIKITQKIILTILIIQVIFAIVNVAQAFSLSDVIQSGNDFLKTGKGEAEYSQDATYSGTIKDIISGIYSILFPIGVATTVIVGGVLGIKFMMASVEDKAKIKEMLVPYIIGCVVIYGALGIWKLAVLIGGNLI